GTVALGDDGRPPSVSEVLDVLSKPEEDTAVNLTGIDVNERPAFFEALLPRIQELRTKTGRPHWIIIDESHHVLPSSREKAGLTVSQRIYGMMLITLEPDRVAPAILSAMDVVIAVGEDPSATLKIFCETVGQTPPALGPMTLQPGEAVVWFRDA